MNRFFKLTVLFAVAFSFTVLVNESFARGHAKVNPAGVHKYRINEYGNGAGNPDRNPDYGPNPTGPGYGGGGSPIKPPTKPPVKKFPIIGLQPVAFPTGPSK
jgi:hypothetical protein